MEKMEPGGGANKTNFTNFDRFSENDWATDEEEIRGAAAAAATGFPSFDPYQIDRRKFMDTTTPSLVDDDEHHTDRYYHSSPRRFRQTPIVGAAPTGRAKQRYSRATGGRASNQQYNNGPNDVLGFGFHLASSIIADSADRSILNPETSTLQQQQQQQPTNPRQGAFSPNTLRLTKDIDNLLQEGDEERHRAVGDAQFVGGMTNSDLAPSTWTSHMFENTTIDPKPTLGPDPGADATTLHPLDDNYNDEEPSSIHPGFSGAFSPTTNLLHRPAPTPQSLAYEMDLVQPNLAQQPSTQEGSAGPEPGPGSMVRNYYHPHCFTALPQSGHSPHVLLYGGGSASPHQPGSQFLSPRLPPYHHQQVQSAFLHAQPHHHFWPKDSGEVTHTHSRDLALQHTPLQYQHQDLHDTVAHQWNEGSSNTQGKSSENYANRSKEEERTTQPLSSRQAVEESRYQHQSSVMGHAISAQSIDQPPPHFFEASQMAATATTARSMAAPPQSEPTPVAGKSSSSETPSKQQTAKRVAGADTRGNDKQTTQPKRDRPLTKKSDKTDETEGLGRKKKLVSTKSSKSKTGQLAQQNPAEPRQVLTNSERTDSRLAFKQFCKVFRNKEKESFASAEEFAFESLRDKSLPSGVHWQVYIELAGLAKRSTRLDESRKLFRKACELQPFAPQGWLEYSKLEEECGNMKKCAAILAQGLVHCEYNESLLTRSVKHEEKMGNLTRARQLLARLKHVGIQKVWKTVLEGALLESRAGNHRMARRVLKYLMHHVPWYGPLYLEAYKLEKDLGCYEEALVVVEKGLKALPRYGPLWFGAFRLCETLDLAESDYELPRTKAMLDRAISKISRELIWKAHLEASQILERSVVQSSHEKGAAVTTEMLDPCRKRVAMTALSCKQNLLWKVWLAGSRMELAAGNLAPARKLLLRADEVVPEKSRITVALDIARVEEFAGDVDLARALLCKYRKRYRFDWKVWLESILLECRHGKYLRAINFARQALQLHSGTGRLWATLVQLRYTDDGEMGQLATLKMALKAVPKSGEVWCQGGRIHLNPFSRVFDLKEARRQLHFATRFTPQYGDGFLETLRLEVIERWVVPIALHIWKVVQPLSGDTSACDDWVSAAISNSVQLLQKARSGVDADEMTSKIEDKSFVPSLRAQLEKKLFGEILETSDLDLRCANADPNYGVLWFFCRHSPIDTSRVIFGRARVLIIEDIKNHVEFYVAAIIRRLAIVTYAKGSVGGDLAKEGWEPGEPEEDETQFNTLSMHTPSLDDVLALNELKPESVSGSDFITGLIQMNRHQPLLDKPFSQRKKYLFGSDVLY